MRGCSQLYLMQILYSMYDDISNLSLLTFGKRGGDLPSYYISATAS